MKRLLLWTPFALVAVAIAIMAWNLVNPTDRRVESALAGQRFPVTTLPNPYNPAQAVDSRLLSDGKPRLVNVFASWCVPCAAEAPMLMQLKAQGVEIIGIAVHDNPDDLGRFLLLNGDPYSQIGMDNDGRTQISLGSAGVPETFIVNGRGVIVRQHIGIVEPDDVAGLVAEIRDLP